MLTGAIWSYLGSPGTPLYPVLPVLAPELLSSLPLPFLPVFHLSRGNICSGDHLSLSLLSFGRTSLFTLQLGHI